MKNWDERTGEEQRLLNPSFCSALLWHAARGHRTGSESEPGMPFEEAFLVLPMTLHRETRESLPRTTATSLAVWLNNYPLARARIADRARLLVPFTKEAIRFGGVHGLLRLSSGALLADQDWRSKMAASLNDSNDEVRFCAKRAELVGKWFAKTGNASTVMSFLGVRP